MSPDFVRYSPDIETIDPDLDELLAQVIAWWENKTRESPKTEGTGRAVRPAHAKSYGFVKADVEFIDDAPAAYAQGIYGKPGRHGALIRFSSANGHLGADALLGGALGFAIKIFDVEGTSLLEDEPDAHTFDLVLKNNPIFLANTAKHYLFIQELVDKAPSYLARGKAGFRELLTAFLTGNGTLQQSEWAWDELFAFVRLAQTPATNPLLTPYWTRGRCGMATTSPRSVSLRLRRAPRRRSITSSTSPVGRTCSGRHWWMSCRHARLTSIFRSSSRQTSTPCPSTT